MLALVLAGCASDEFLQPWPDSMPDTPGTATARQAPETKKTSNGDAKGDDAKKAANGEPGANGGNGDAKGGDESSKEAKPHLPHTIWQALRARCGLYSPPCASAADEHKNGNKEGAAESDGKKSPAAASSAEPKKGNGKESSDNGKQNGADSAKEKNGKDKKKNGAENDREKKEEMQKVLQLVAEGKMTVEEAQTKLAEKTDDGKDKEDKDKDKDKDKEEDKIKLLPEGWNFHAQTTIIPNFQPGFGALYSGPNSLSPERQREATLTADLFLGAPLWCGAEFHADLLMWQGFGLSNSFGLEAFPNTDAFKAGTAEPRFMFARFFVRQTIGLGGEQEDVPDGPLTLPGQRDVSRFTVTVGRMSMMDIFDNNTYNHDPHTQFMNYSSTMLDWDFASDTVGFTTGIAFELNQKDWAVRYGWFQMPATPNGFTSDDRILMWPIAPEDRTTDGEFWKQWGMAWEFERRWHIEDHPGAIRLQSWLEQGRWASYNLATVLLRISPAFNTPQGVEANIPAAAFDFHYKYGFGVNWEQELVKNVGTFGRVGWQDGQTAPAAFNDSNWTVQLGVSVKGADWRRPDDTFGFSVDVAGASDAQIAFLKAGGLGIQSGDGNLTYAPETSFETYYDIGINKCLHLAFDYQFYADPAFNRVRGPLSVFAARLHWEY
jgi:high affinity Mn2+ porin